jgi:hypothetical protein
VAREELLEQAELPLFERLGQDGVAAVSAGRSDRSLGVRKDLCGDLPSLVVRHVLFVDKDTHELGDGDGGVRVVHCGVSGDTSIRATHSGCR